MDGLVSSFQYSSSRFTTSLYDKGENDKTTTTTATTTTQTLATATNAVSERDANGGNQGGGNGNNGGIATAITATGVQFGATLGNAIAQEAIVNRALELVQSVRETMFGELSQALGFSSDIINKVVEQQAFIEALNENEFAMSGLTLGFSATLVSGAQSQSVNVSVSLSQSFLQNNFSSTDLSTYTALRNMFLLTGEIPQIDTVDSWIHKAYNAYGSSSRGTSVSSLTRVEFSSISLQTLSNVNSTNVNVSLSSLSVDTSIVRWQGNDSVNLVDPLIIDLGGDGVELSDDTFSFDLDADGESDQISRPKGNSGFLALDKNGDGIINDGTELFGTQNGDGFKDLARYDSNGDGKIDKDDPIYDKLRIWKPGANGDQGELIGLGEVGIGAIYLDAKNNEQLMQSASGETLGVQRKSAAYQRTDGSEGQVYHIDLAKRDEQSSAVSKGAGIAAYHKSQNDLDLLRTLVGNTKNEDASANNTGSLENITQLTPTEIRQQIEEIKNGNVSEENLALVQLDALLGKAKNSDGLLAILNRVAFDGNLSSVNDQFFNYQALVNAQRLLA